MSLILASTSVFRRDLLARLLLPFEAVSPSTDETALADETPAQTAERLAISKARSVSGKFPASLIIGSDQVAYCGAQRFGKPGNRTNAMAQLRSMRGKEIIFHTGLCLLNSATGRLQACGVPTTVRFRDLSDKEIERYLQREDALDCAGSAKSEGLGIALLDYLRCDDPTALIGLPLIALSGMLRAEGIALP